jgi:hypothetical protein
MNIFFKKFNELTQNHVPLSHKQKIPRIKQQCAYFTPLHISQYFVMYLRFVGYRCIVIQYRILIYIFKITSPSICGQVVEQTEQKNSFTLVFPFFTIMLRNVPKVLNSLCVMFRAVRNVFHVKYHNMNCTL